MFNKSFQSLQCSKNIHLGGITAGNHHHHPCLDKSPTFSRFFLMESAHLSALPCPAPFFNCLIQNGDLGGEVELRNLPLIFASLLLQLQWSSGQNGKFLNIPPNSR